MIDHTTSGVVVRSRKDQHIIMPIQVKLSEVLFSTGLPMGISLRFQNSGNVDIVPRGRAMLVDPFGRVVAKGIINEDSARILPESFRVYHLKLSPLSAYVLPGPYTVMTEYRFDGQDAFQTIPEQRVFAWGIAFWWLVGIGAISFGIRTLRRKLKSTRTL
jgi:hypothetical protein